MKILVVGDEGAFTYEFVEGQLSVYNKNQSDIIVYGCDEEFKSHAVDYAIKKNIPLKFFHNERIADMVEYSDMLIAFDNGKCERTKELIDLMQKANKLVIVLFNYK